MNIEIGTKIYQEEPKIAIFESKGRYLICTKSRGAMTGGPMYVYGSDVVGVVEFKG
jgi:hypothetical protein